MFAPSDTGLSWLQTLNGEQHAAATYEGETLLTGAGTGKTTTLSSRVAWLLSNGRASSRPRQVLR